MGRLGHWLGPSNIFYNPLRDFVERLHMLNISTRPISTSETTFGQEVGGYSSVDLVKEGRCEGADDGEE